MKCASKICYFKETKIIHSLKILMSCPQIVTINKHKADLNNGTQPDISDLNS